MTGAGATTFFLTPEITATDISLSFSAPPPRLSFQRKTTTHVVRAPVRVLLEPRSSRGHVELLGLEPAGQRGAVDGPRRRREQPRLPALPQERCRVGRCEGRGERVDAPLDLLLGRVLGVDVRAGRVGGRGFGRGAPPDRGGGGREERGGHFYEFFFFLKGEEGRRRK